MTRASVVTISKYKMALPPTLPTFFEIAHSTDAKRDGQKNDRVNKNFDDLNKASTKDTHPNCDIRKKMAEQRPRRDGQQYPKRQIGKDPSQ